MWRKKTALIILTVVFSVACEKALIEPDKAQDPGTTFEYLWNVIDEGYSLFPYKKVDWDSVYHEYEPKIHDQMSDEELFEVLGNMLKTLRDGHVNLRSSFDRSRYWNWYLDSSPNFKRDILERNYWGDDHNITGPLINTVIDSVGYVYYGSFGQTIDDKHIDYVVNRFADLKGIIIDVRNNGGGSTGNSRRLASRFAPEKRTYGFRQYKDGPAHEDLSEKHEMTISPAGDGPYSKPVIVLTNRKSYSATNDFALRMRAIPDVTIIGDTTGGGGGMPVSRDLPNGWNVRFSSTVTYAPDGFNVESGIPPDEHVSLKTSDENDGIDSILERALEIIEEQ